MHRGQFSVYKCSSLLFENKDGQATQIPLYRVTSNVTGTRYVSVPFSSLLNILCNSSQHVAALVDYFKEMQAENIEPLTFEIRSSKSHDLFENSGCFYSSRNYLHNFIDLQKEISLIYNSFHKTAVQQTIKKSEKSGLAIRRADQQVQVHDFYRLYCLTRHRVGVPPMPLVFFKNLFSTFLESRTIEVYIADYEGKSVAALLLIKHGKTVCVEFAGDDYVHRNIHPNHFLYWNCIKLAHQEGFKFFSFGRTYHSNKGLLQFKQRWCTQEEQMVEYYYPKAGHNISTKENMFIYRCIRCFSPQLPMPIFRLMGNIIYKHLG